MVCDHIELIEIFNIIINFVCICVCACAYTCMYVCDKKQKKTSVWKICCMRNQTGERRNVLHSMKSLATTWWRQAKTLVLALPMVSYMYIIFCLLSTVYLYYVCTYSLTSEVFVASNHICFLYLLNVLYCTGGLDGLKFQLRIVT